MSESEEMYLISIAQLNEAGKSKPVPLSDIANILEIQPVSVNQMIRKLEQAGLLTYIPYKGVEFTSKGERVAAQVIRKRRLWEVFLVDYLGFRDIDAEGIACRLEHVFSEVDIERLADFLGYPSLSPQGKSIPEAQIPSELCQELALSSVKVGERCEISKIMADNTTRRFLSQSGMAPRTKVSVMAATGKGDVLVETEKGNSIHLDSNLVDLVWVKGEKNE